MAVDSPRWCAECWAYGDHHTDRHEATVDPNACKSCKGSGKFVDETGYVARCRYCDGTGKR